TDSRGGIFGGPGVSVSSSRVNGVDQDGIHLICAQHHGDPPTPKLPVVVNNNVIDAAGGYGIFVEGVFLDDCAPVSVRGNTVTNSGTAAPRHPAIAVGAFVAGLGPGQDIGDYTGGGNCLDVTILSVRVSTSATCIASTNS